MAKFLKKNWLNIVVIALSIFLIIVGCKLIDALYKLTEVNTIYGINKLKAQSDTIDMIDTISEIRALFEMYGLDEETDYSEVEQDAINYYMHSTNDKYASYKSPVKAEVADMADNGDRSGIGISVSFHKGVGLYINYVWASSPGKKAGLKVNDYVVAVDGTDISDLEYYEMLAYLKGNPGDIKVLTVDRQGELIDCTVILGYYETHSVTTDDKNGVAYIKIEEFSNISANEFITAMETFKSKGYTKYIIDLRNNPGGHLESVLPITDYMVGEGVILSIQDKEGKTISTFTSDAEEFYGDLVVLVNENTASASEMFSQTIKEFGKGLIVGKTTFGKGTVVTEYTLSNGGTATISTGTYRTHSGECLEGIGVIPDYEVDIEYDGVLYFYELTDEEDSQLQKALELLNAA